MAGLVARLVVVVVPIVGRRMYKQARLSFFLFFLPFVRMCGRGRPVDRGQSDDAQDEESGRAFSCINQSEGGRRIFGRLVRVGRGLVVTHAASTP
jgi:hypothetical protein